MCLKNPRKKHRGGGRRTGWKLELTEESEVDTLDEEEGCGDVGGIRYFEITDRSFSRSPFTGRGGKGDGSP